jgi:hypothetical protein
MLLEKIHKVVSENSKDKYENMLREMNELSIRSKVVEQKMNTHLFKTPNNSMEGKHD